MQIFFTKSERSVKKHTQTWILGQVKAVLDTKGIESICLNKLPYNYDELYTTEKASEIIYGLIEDSVYYGGHRM